MTNTIRNVRWDLVEVERAERRCAYLCLGVVLGTWAALVAALTVIWL